MDPELLKQHSAFRNRALARPVVEARPAPTKPAEPLTVKTRPPPKPITGSEAVDNFRSRISRPGGGGSQYKFGVLAKIVKHMKDRYIGGDPYPLTLDEILDEINQEIPEQYRSWLETEALANNPKIDVVEGSKYLFRPKYRVKDRAELRQLLQRYQSDGCGGILFDDLEESVPKARKRLKAIEDCVISIERPDKKEVVFYNDPSVHLTVDEELKKLWHSCSVDETDEKKIEDYLEKQGITAAMTDFSLKRNAQLQNRRKQAGKKDAKKQRDFKKLNTHLEGVLLDVSELPKKKPGPSKT